ncbi:WLM domain-containing protein [Xylariomycetidae sp. FL0641]|nr:WLM domain-containing protein [Xylariomycetidae sp. FL0641]
MAEQDYFAQEHDTVEQTASVSIVFSHHGKEHTYDMFAETTLADFANEVEDDLNIPVNHQKYMVSKLGMLKPPFDDRPITELEGKKISLLGSSNAEIASLNKASDKAAARHARRELARRNPSSKVWTRRSSTRQLEDAMYTFATLRPLPNLPNPQKSLDFLERLKNDPGIKATMRAHKFSVGLLTEMDPLSYTEASHEGTSRILGLNRNKGEVIELRLRTDAYDGYRDYKTIRKTLCHELAHNVHGPHDRLFWDLCHAIEREVARSDWKSGGQSVGESDFYDPSEEVAYDHGGWTGGEFVLGGGTPAGAANAEGGALSRREILAKAAEKRLQHSPGAQPGPGAGTPGPKPS